MQRKEKEIHGGNKLNFLIISCICNAQFIRQIIDKKLVISAALQYNVYV